MATTNYFNNNKNIRLKKNTVITITKRTLRFARNVYQTQNITGFGEGEVEIGQIPWGIIITMFIIGLIIVTFRNEIGLLLILIAIAGAVWNFAKPKHYGLLLTLNSGDKALFVTKDKQNLKNVIDELYEMMEAGESQAYQIIIKDSRVEGNFVQGYAGGNVSYR